MWMLSPFQKALAKRQRETTLIAALDECVGRLFTTPTSPGLNLEMLSSPAGQPVLSARIDRAFRLILTPLGPHELGLLHFDNHDEAYRWVDRHRAQLPTMLSRVQEVARNTPVSRTTSPMPSVRLDEDDPLAVASLQQWRRMLNVGIARYLAYLDEDQKRIAEMNATGLLLVKGGAGTGKTAVAIHRLLWHARQPVLDGLGASRVLYLCFNRALAAGVELAARSLCFDRLPDDVEIATFHHWSLTYLQQRDAASDSSAVVPTVDADAVRQRTYREYGRLTQEQRTHLVGLTGSGVFDEIEQVSRPTAWKTAHPTRRSTVADAL